MNPLLRELLEGYRVLEIRPVAGGDINQAYRVETPDGPVFAKCHAHPQPDMFARESASLRTLREAAGDGLSVPEVLAETAHGLVLEWIDPGRGRPGTESDFGFGLAGVHGVRGAAFGGLDGELAGYLGSVEVDLSPSADWAEFFFTRRICTLAGRAVAQGVLSPAALPLLDKLEPRASELCGPPEPPALLHGDLWAGNRMVDSAGRNWIIDPASHWGHREYDLAMMRLFGGFGAEAFAAYEEAFPLAEGWRSRIRWYQLPPLLVHAILFGGGYADSALAVLSDYAA
ncbi:MAG: fructosamine kinase family protein [Propionibacteriaceae bacterium]|nr:fructosamine kinase family protein [Propionibacteriaceae bacterium]